MTNPPDYKHLWKNVKWKNQEEKLAFFNKYFREHKFVRELIDDKVKRFKGSILEFSKQKEIQDGKNKRQLKVSDIIKELER